jgi:hypothetical protein
MISRHVSLTRQQLTLHTPTPLSPHFPMTMAMSSSALGTPTSKSTCCFYAFPPCSSKVCSAPAIKAWKEQNTRDHNGRRCRIPGFCVAMHLSYREPLATSIHQVLKLFAVADKLDVQCALQSLRVSLTQLLVAEHIPLPSWALWFVTGSKKPRKPLPCVIILRTFVNPHLKSWLMSAQSNIWSC